MRLKKEEGELLKEAEQYFLSYFTMEENEGSHADTLEGAVDVFKNYLIARGLLEEDDY